jgi:type IV secretory pathway VirB2 component (pilin)
MRNKRKLIVAMLMSLATSILLLPSRAYAQSGEVIQIGSIDNLLWSIVKTIQYYTLPVMAIVIAFFGFKLMTSGDDTSSKENSKSWIIKILIGGVVIFGAATIANVIKGAVGG